MLAEKLNMTDEEAERWIVNLIRHARLDAKIDSSKGHVVMGTQAVSPYSQLIEKTKALSLRTQMLALQIEKRIATNRAGEVSPCIFVAQGFFFMYEIIIILFLVQPSQWGTQDF